MSIFKESFTPEIRKSLETRQNAIKNRNKTSIVYLNTRTAWIKMSSSVNVYSKNAPNNPTQEQLLDEKNYDDNLAKQYVLQGGILNSGKLKSGVGGYDNVYSNVNQDGLSYQRGIRPMPGINSIDIKSKSAYGSLREIVVNFQCWDIKQLEDLELLYMRPGYTVLIEWGWTPYININDNNKLESTISTYDFFSKIKPKEDIWRELFIKSNNSGGNYDAMFGFIKNYSWSARADGGYDCSTTIISIGEIIESLKINYNSIKNLTLGGRGKFLNSIIDEVIVNAYKKNKLAGIFAELYKYAADIDSSDASLIIASEFISPTSTGIANTILNIGSVLLSSSNNLDKNNGIVKSLPVTNGNKSFNLDFFIRDVLIENNSNIDNNKDALVGTGADKTHVYITLESLTTLLNEFVILSDGKNKTSLIKLSTKERLYDKIDKTEKDLLCLSHPLQLSIDPTICYIKNQNWGELKKSTILDKDLEIKQKTEEFLNTPIIPNPPNYNVTLDYIEKQVKLDGKSYVRIFRGEISSIDDEENKIKQILKKLKEDNNPDAWRELNRQCLIRKQKTLYRLLKPGFNAVGLDDDEIISLVGANYSTLINVDIAEEFEKTLEPLIEKRDDAAKQAEYLKNKDVKPFFYDSDPNSKVGDPNSGIGVIGNIYVNLQFLYSLILSNSLENTDKKEKQEINLYDFIKNVLTQISNSIGNINNFDIHVDPIDNNICRIIDINYVDSIKRDIAYEDAFELELHSLKSTVRSYNFESKIYPEQSTIIAIGAQVKGGALGTNTNTLVDFNRGIIDRIIPRKEEENNQEDQRSLINEQLASLNEALGTIYEYLGENSGIFVIDPSYDVQSTAKYAGALRDLIEYSRSFFDDEPQDSKNRSIIPTKLSFEMDGIGGLIIGHIFKIPEYLLPKGYKSFNNIERKIAYVITGIGHKILENNDWVTNIESQFIILNKPQKNGTLSQTTSPQNKISKDIIQGNIGNFKNSGIGSVAEDSIKYPILIKTEAYKLQYNANVQKYAKVNPNTPVADSVRRQLNSNYITTTENQLSGNGDITPELGNAIVTLQKLIISNPTGFSFINSKKPIRITAGNDNFHRTYSDKRNTTTHCRGLAIDIGTREFTSTQVNSIMSALRESGFTYVIYHTIKSGAYHIHANIKTT